MPDSPTSLDALTDAVLRASFGPGALERGRAYADQDRVTLLGTGPGTIKAACIGSGSSAYVVHVRWIESDGFVELADSCSCPLEGECKHCVAAILTARRALADAADDDDDAPLTLALARAGEPPRPGPDWRHILADLPLDADPGPGYSDLALQVAITHPRPSRRSMPGPTPVLRPLRRGRAGAWVKTGATWYEISSPYRYRYGPDALDVDPLQRSVLVGLMASGGIDTHYATAQAVPLDRFGPDLWHHLQQATAAGVQLLDERGATVVVSPERARVTIDLTASADAAVAIGADIVIDGEPLRLDAARSGFVGTPAHGLWRTVEDQIHLVPLDQPLHPAIARLAAGPSVVVPARDVDELLDHYQPALALHAVVGSSDGSVAITANRFDGLVLAVHRSALDTADLRWFARYRRGERVVDHPLGPPPGRSRDRPAEAEALDALDLPTHLIAGLADAGGGPAALQLSGPDVVTLLTEVVPWLEASDGVAVEITGDQPPLREADDTPLISLRITDGVDRRDGTDWFDLDVEVSVEGQEVDFVHLFTALDRGDRAMILPSGTWLRIDGPELARLRALITEARGLAEPGATGIARLNRYQTSWWDELAGLGVVAEQSQRWQANVDRMAALATPEPIAVPDGFTATLRPYQHEGLDWLAFLHRHGLGGILADDMGLGKTVQVLALCLHVLEHKPDARFLVVAPTSVVENWSREASRFAPDVDVRTIRETATRRGTDLRGEIGDARIVVTSYALFRLEFDDYAEHAWELLLLDEAQFVKNHQGKTYQCARRLDAATKIAITGTPLENTLMDLWALLSITAPGLYPDPKRFSDTYRRPIERGEAPQLLVTLRRRIAPLLRRRTKDAVLTELPPKTEQTVEVELSARHGRIYQTQLQRQRQKVLGLVDDVQKNRFEILKSLTLLRQLALDPALVEPAHEDIGSAKLDRLLDDLGQVIAEGHRALVFSQFTRYLSRVKARLDAAGIEYAYLDGRTRNRERAISRFKDGDAPVFVISLKAGGFGLNLTEADYCFVLDPWWNPATETQAVDRTHRIGQTNPVVVYRYVSAGTIEEKVMELKARKADLFASVIEAEGALAGALTDADIRGLLDLG